MQLKSVLRRLWQSIDEKLEEKVKELLADTQMEENRIAAEVVIFCR